MGLVPDGTDDSHVGFPNTLWSVVLAAGDARSPCTEAALEQLCRAYWRPLYAFLRRQGNAPADAKDLVQGFLVRLLDRGDLAHVAPDKGRFRTYLLAGIRNHVIKREAHAHAAKRDRRREVVPIDLEDAERLYGAESYGDGNPELAYDRRWARTALARALARLGEEHHARGKGAWFEVLAPFLDGTARHDYEGAGRRLGQRPNTVAVAVKRLRSRLAELFRAEVRQTVGPTVDVDQEIRQLLGALAAR